MAKTKACVNKCSDLSKKKSVLRISSMILSQKRILDNNTMNIHSCSILCLYSDAVEMSTIQRLIEVGSFFFFFFRTIFQLFPAVYFSLLTLPGIIM